MTRMVTAQCPNCGASLRVDPDFEATTCKYCNATAFVKTRVRPVTERVTKQYPLVINATTGVAGWIYWAVGLSLVAVLGTSLMLLNTNAKHQALTAVPLAAATSSAPVSTSPPPAKGEGLAVEPLTNPEVGGTNVVEGTLKVTGRLPPEVVRRILRQSVARFRHCYDEGLRRTPNLAGRVAVRFVIGRDGKVTQAADAGSTISDTQVAGCVAAAITGIAFPAPEGGIAIALYPLDFSRN